MVVDRFHLRFDRVGDAEEAALIAFFAQPQLTIRGTDGRPWPEFRGGCLPLLVVGGAMVSLPMLLQWDLHQMVVLLVVTGWLGWGTAQLIRTARANRRSKRLAALPGGWHGVAWDVERFALRSFADNVLVPWRVVQEVRFLDQRWGVGLADTLWMHMEDGRKVQLPSKDGRFCGRTPEEWFEDLAEALRTATERLGTRPAPVTR